jgi:hypothetical protein
MTVLQRCAKSCRMLCGGGELCCDAEEDRGGKIGGQTIGGGGGGATHDRMDKDPASFWVVALGARIFCNMWERC